MQATFGSNIGSNELSFEYNYAYTPGGAVSGKTVQVQSADHLSSGGVPASGALTAGYTYDNQGALTTVTYPPGGTQTVFIYSLDAMERPTGMTDQSNYAWASGVTPLYDGRETRTYNSLLADH
jgi:predicted outer membrane repeat protein